MRSNSLRSVLVVQTAFIGDVVLVIPLLKAIHNFWPDAYLDIMVRPPAHNLVETLPYVRSVIVFDKYGTDRGMRGVKRTARLLSENLCDVAFIPHRSFRSGLIPYLSGIPGRIGFSKGGGRIFHTRRIPYPRGNHEIQRNLKLLSTLGISPAAEPPEVISTLEDVEFVNDKLSVVEGSTLIAFAPGSVWFTKRWLEEYFIQVGESCIQRGWRVVLIGGEEDSQLCGSISDALGSECLDLSGKTSLRQSVEVLRRTALLVSNDSAPTHLGIAAGTRVITIFGSTTPEFGFAPFGSKGKSLGIELDCRPCTDHGRQRCPKKHLRCLKDISPEMVFEEIVEMLEDIPE